MRMASVVGFRVVRASRTVSEAVLLRYVLTKTAKLQGRPAFMAGLPRIGKTTYAVPSGVGPGA
jgi:hypothetical protein